MYSDLVSWSQHMGVRTGAGCGWLFLDSSRNHTRRGCDMRVCGNRAKARRHYERQRDRGKE